MIGAFCSANQSLSRTRLAGDITLSSPERKQLPLRSMCYTANVQEHPKLAFSRTHALLIRLLLGPLTL